MASRFLRPFGRLLPSRRLAATSPGITTPMPAPETQVSYLANGLAVATERIPDIRTATVGVWIDAGSRAESKANNGAAHFLEHMAFKGTKQRGQRDLELLIENKGAHLNAYTSREHTVFYAKMFGSDVPEGIAILSDILQNPLLDESAIERERQVILREQEEVDKLMDEVVFDHLHATAFQDSSLGYTILGPKQNILGLSKGDLEAYIRDKYTSEKMCVVAVGDVDHDKVVKEADQYFGGLKKGSGRDSYKQPHFTGSDVIYRVDDLNMAHLALAVESVGWSHPDHWPLIIASSIVGAWDRTLGAQQNLSNPLAQLIASENLANSFMSFNTTYTDSGLFGIYLTSSAKKNLDKLLFDVIREWKRLAVGLTPADVSRGKQRLKSSLLLALDGTTPIAEDIGRQMLVYGERKSPAQVEQEIDNVTYEDVKRVVQDYLYDQDLALVAVGPVEAVPDYVRLRSAMNWLRY